MGDTRVTYKSAWAIVDVVLEKDPVDAVRFHQELDNLQDRLSPKTQPGGAFKFLFSRLHPVFYFLHVSHVGTQGATEK